MKKKSRRKEEPEILKNLLRQKEKEIYSILRIGKALSSTLKLDELLVLIMQEITRLMDADRSTLFLVDNERHEIWSKIALKAEVKEIRQKLGKGISGHVALTGETINIPDAYNDNRFDPSTDKRTGYRTRSILCMPVWEPLSTEDNRQIMGVIQVLNKKEGVFTEEDEALLETLAAQVAISVANSRLYHQLEKKYQELDLLYEFEQYLSTIYNLPELIEKLMGKTIQHLQAQHLLAFFPYEKEFAFAAVSKDAPFRYQKNPSVFPALLEIAKSPSRETIESNKEIICRRFTLPEDAIGEEFPVLFSTIEIASEGRGLLLGLNVQQEDRADLEDERKLLSQVAQKIARAVELHQLRESLLKQERLSAIGQMMSTIVHDIRGPINTVYGFADLMADESTSQKDREEFAMIIRQEVQSMMTMATEVLDFAKGKTNILPRKTSVPNILKKVKPRLQQMCQQNNIQLNLQVESSELLYADEERINRVFFNIAKNAIEAMGKKGGKLTFRAQDEGDQIVFRISDTGPGIPEEIKEHIFDSFVTSGKKSGTGLGLAIVKKIVEEHKGRIEIDSAPGEGATFSIYIPKFKKQYVE